MRKNIKLILIAVIGVSSFALLLFFNFNVYNQPINQKDIVYSIDLQVDYNNGTIKVRQNFTLEGGKTTAFDALDLWCDVQFDTYGWGIIVQVIDGVSGNWLYFVNGIAPSMSSTFYSLEDGDLVEWKRN